MDICIPLGLPSRLEMFVIWLWFGTNYVGPIVYKLTDMVLIIGRGVYANFDDFKGLDVLCKKKSKIVL